MLQPLFDLFRTALRPTEIDTLKGKMLYSDAHKEYELLYPEIKRSVSNIESFVKLVLVENERRHGKKEKFGHNMTVAFTQNGGYFYPDEETRLDYYEYKRQYSQSFQAIETIKDRWITHGFFLEFIQKLSPFMAGANETYKLFSKVDCRKNAKVISQPLVDENAKREESYTFIQEFFVNDVTKKDQVSIPTKLELDIPLVKASNKTYPFTLNINLKLNEGQLMYMLTFPGMEILIEQMIQDEMEYFIEKTQEVLPKLPVLFDY